MHVRSVRSKGMIETTLRGSELLKTPDVNKGTAFTEEERQELGLAGLLPPRVLNIDEQARRAYEQYSKQPNDLAKNAYLNALHDRNQVLFYRLLTEHVEEMMPIVYTPTVGQAIERYSHEYQRSRGVYLSIDNPDGIEQAFENLNVNPEEIDLVLATDGERILGIGDWGVGGIQICNGKLALYTAAGGIDPNRVIPVILDTGTNNESLLNDPVYIGTRHSRVRGERYDEFVDTYVSVATRMFPNAMIHWEDFSQANARPILERYRDNICTLNDDIQGTGAVTLAVILSAVRASHIPLSEHRIVMFGAGSAGVGVSEQVRDAMIREGVPQEEANKRFWLINSRGLVTMDSPRLRQSQIPYARSEEEVRGWKREPSGDISLLEVIRQVHPTILIGTSTVAGAFTEEIVREMSKHAARPVILPLSNPTTSSEAVPADLLEWTNGSALIATGSPYAPVVRGDVTYTIGQANNAFVFPGIGLGVAVSRATRVTDGMLEAAARAVTGMVNVEQPGASLVPDVHELRAVSATVAVAVATAAVEEGVARIQPEDMIQAVHDAMWRPEYPIVRPLSE
ncbi:NAD-dependent malic enzyme [Alicyclobacillus sp. SO9]|uniref:NAD-dependent malic enzyme n=1 Tax=Alicyclobacillus sp. SO9 TaxID=2665646 RepID=UPI0018E8B472|nr:NAD-dependent malic enzyme [Alicyclobacillus sp. SO9]QQE80060.1 NAD-dependent malic enzyme [Alicyclobacillus sp. SO9]